VFCIARIATVVACSDRRAVIRQAHGPTGQQVQRAGPPDSAARRAASETEPRIIMLIFSTLLKIKTAAHQCAVRASVAMIAPASHGGGTGRDGRPLHGPRGDGTAGARGDRTAGARGNGRRTGGRDGRRAGEGPAHGRTGLPVVSDR
jgi:hypothetical protein